MKKIITVTILILLPLATVDAGRRICSGKKGGISHCEGTKFRCNDGSFSQSKKTCTLRPKTKKKQAKGQNL